MLNRDFHSKFVTVFEDIFSAHPKGHSFKADLRSQREYQVCPFCRRVLHWCSGDPLAQQVSSVAFYEPLCATKEQQRSTHKERNTEGHRPVSAMGGLAQW